jgi:2-dehydropantoate 2-reductase
MKITIVGAGAIGGTAGVLLHKAGHDVLLVDRDPAHVAAINEHGYRLTGIIEATEPVPAVVPDELEKIVKRHGPLGTVILAVKAMDTVSATEFVKPLLADDGYIVSFQNGLNEETIATIVGANRTIGAFIHYGADLVEPGHVVFANRPPTYLSELDGVETPRIRQLADTLSVVTEVIVTDNLNGYLWGKLCYAALAFVVSSVDAPIDEVVVDPRAQPVIREAVAEVVDVAKAQNIAIENIHGFEGKIFDRSNPNRIAETTALFERWSADGKNAIKRHMGIHRDIAVRKRRTEVDFQVGPVVAKGRELGVPTPVCAQLVERIHEIEAGTRAHDWSTIESLGQHLAGTTSDAGA